ncbi:Sulfate permease, MFS superfamily [Ekhidna lutea]|uniref:Sulfate permease, MFS superfamily n=1 Tax=Ekhidna lutea TaxID=447679 RepID=A0A239EB15_EKHLU|nr:SulP family inorganic anion transporter [Ekhidna lutea]SNS41699.1 Sulfate permease, MFS superfamily [Ekhidna lutea]
MDSHKTSIFKNFKSDIPASIVVFLVAVPLCLGIALASGAPLFSGIISGIVGGIIVGLISGSSVGVSGPAAGLAVIVLAGIQDLESFPVFLAAVVVSGIIQILLGIAKAGIIGYYFPSSVIKGMLSAIGIIIFLKQIPHAFGYDADPEGDLEFVQPDGENTFSELITMLDFIQEGAVIIFAISMAVLILWERPFMKRIKIFQVIQGPLIVVTAGIIINQLFAGSSLYIDETHMVSLPVAGTFMDFINQFTFFDPAAMLRKDVLILGATIAVVGSLETLLCVEATDKLDPQKRITPTNRELVAQGTGNIISGMIGGLPITQVIVRSSANIQSGGKTKLSPIFHGVLLLISAIFIPNILNLIPLSSLAAILIVVGYKLAKPSLFKKMYAAGRSEFIPFMVTILGIIFTDLLIGIIMGLVVGIFHILYNNFRKPYVVKTLQENGETKLRLELSENLTFLNKASIIETVSHLPDDSDITIDASRSHFIHPDIMEIFDDFRQNAEYRNIKLEIIGLDKEHANPMRELKEVTRKF